ncbi:hypothetical protein ACFIJ5_01800 [Haloimpatiens sp. FM7330]
MKKKGIIITLCLAAVISLISDKKQNKCKKQEAIDIDTDELIQ